VDFFSTYLPRWLPCRPLPVGHAVALIAGDDIGLDAEVSSREHQESVVVAAGDVQSLAIGTDGDHIRALPGRDRRVGRAHWPRSASDCRGTPTPPASRSKCGSSGALRACPTWYAQLLFPCHGLLPLPSHHRDCRCQRPNWRLSHETLPLDGHRWRTHRAPTTAAEPHQQYSRYRGRQPLRHFIGPAVHLHVQLSPLKCGHAVYARGSLRQRPSPELHFLYR
jgi:hypothetical protein